MSDERVSLSPKSASQNAAGKHTTSTCSYALAILKQINYNARVTGVVRYEKSKLLKLSPGEGASAHSQMASLKALRIAFPFCTISAIESPSTGDTEFQILVSTDSETFFNAKACYSNMRFFRVLLFLSNIALLVSFLSFVCLMHAALIRTSAVDG